MPKDFSSYTDGQLVKGILKKDWFFLRELFKRYTKPFFNLSYRFSGDRQTAEDLTSEILWRIYKNLNKFDIKKPFKPWAFKVATNVCLTYSKTKQRSVTFSSILWWRKKNEGLEEVGEFEVEDKKTNLMEEIEKNEISRRVQKALKKLPEKYRLCLYLYYFEDLKYEEIADNLEIPINTVRTHIKRGKEGLKKYLGDLL